MNITDQPSSAVVCVSTLGDSKGVRSAVRAVHIDELSLTRAKPTFWGAQPAYIKNTT